MEEVQLQSALHEANKPSVVELIELKGYHSQSIANYIHTEKHIWYYNSV